MCRISDVEITAVGLFKGDALISSTVVADDFHSDVSWSCKSGLCVLRISNETIDSVEVTVTSGRISQGKVNDTTKRFRVTQGYGEIVAEEWFANSAPTNSSDQIVSTNCCPQPAYCCPKTPPPSCPPPPVVPRCCSICDFESIYQVSTRTASLDHSDDEGGAKTSQPVQKPHYLQGIAMFIQHQARKDDTLISGERSLH